ncbi:hypothetical protein [Candidatus Nitrosocosmicus arcticus]|uniref:Putative Intradiol ring-cleavage dioxygenase n=1 Tax=Candidatus Nitrosocosmicus arcticus TaxID=2035267 RepID=A0A557SZ20_9ARCH|nr:hypothetical protein [Candidatus Nitrosocosmicus arcticus]TVP41835.1 putative Intradiol ring-cleavage dioxygenase [Candidatus Nitrosocosmicus arcticus]
MNTYKKVLIFLTIAFLVAIPLDIKIITNQLSFAQSLIFPDLLPSTSPPPFDELSEQQKAASTNKTCTLTPSLIEIEGTPQQIEGPYFVDGMSNRSDLRSEPSDGSIQEGIPLNINFSVYKVLDSDGDGKGTCVPFTGAKVDLWEANSQGLYSGVREEGTKGLVYLRGYQTTDENGTAKFETIYPGWYENRAIHIHLKVRDFEGPEKIFEWTSQLYLNNSINELVHTQPPYSNHGPVPNTNEQDFIFMGPSTDGLIKNNTGNHLTLDISKSDGGYSGTFNVGLNATAKP